MELKTITEIGIVVRDLEKATRNMVEAFRGRTSDIYHVPAFGMRFRMVNIGNIDIELMESTSDDGVIAKHINTKGEGLHHIAFSVDNLEDQILDMKKSGYKLVNEVALDIFGAKVTFLHPKSFSGVVIELIQYPENWQGWFSGKKVEENGSS